MTAPHARLVTRQLTLRAAMISNLTIRDECAAEPIA
jgi:hypothetical protein